MLSLTVTRKTEFKMSENGTLTCFIFNNPRFLQFRTEENIVVLSVLAYNEVLVRASL